jgi:hypothetical protein
MFETERLRVLRMLEAGQITADEAATLLDALQPAGAEARARRGGKTLRVRITNPLSGAVETFSVPLSAAQLAARAGIGLSGIWSPHVGDLDLAEVFRAIDGGQSGQVLRWTDEGGRRVELEIAD